MFTVQAGRLSGMRVATVYTDALLRLSQVDFGGLLDSSATDELRPFVDPHVVALSAKLDGVDELSGLDVRRHRKSGGAVPPTVLGIGGARNFGAVCMCDCREKKRLPVSPSVAHQERP